MKQRSEPRLFGLPVSSRQLLILVFAAAVLFRICCVVATGPYERQHDWSGDYGHYEYVKTIANEGRLPDNNSWQNYHPPLSHLVLAGGYSLLSGFVRGADGAPDDEKISDLLQIVPLIYGILLLFVVYFVLKELGLSGGMLLAGFSAFAFHPTGIILSASLNNDMLTWLLYGCAFLFTLKWYKKPTFANIVFIGLSIALSMLSKFSGVMIAPLVAFVFLYVFIKSKGKRLRLFAQFAVFAAVCIPLGLSFTIRNYLLFGQPLGYVAYMGDSNWQYIDLPLVRRLFGYYAPDFASPFSDAYRNNILSTCFKTSLFGEWGAAFGGWSDRFGAGVKELAGWVLTAAAAVFTAASAFLSVRYAAAKTERGVAYAVPVKIFILGNFVLQFGFFIYFNSSYPFGCTADFRYLAPTLLTLACVWPLGLKTVKSRVLKTVLCASAAVFSLCSVIFFAVAA